MGNVRNNNRHMLFHRYGFPEKDPVSLIIKVDSRWTIGLINEVNYVTFIEVLTFFDCELNEKRDFVNSELFWFYKSISSVVSILILRNLLTIREF